MTCQEKKHLAVSHPNQPLNHDHCERCGSCIVKAMSTYDVLITETIRDKDGNYLDSIHSVSIKNSYFIICPDCRPALQTAWQTFTHSFLQGK